ncbi:hypothetical protein CK203_034647 [Vitis vinifera]|uniref:Uncharacterized protein n=1 Tax=Vitis vinifera TaxID=29760 RepID=A0A438HWH5_VITVI|nr:hypothetical protein CK203_034647 [Vitis vinifera]
MDVDALAGIAASLPIKEAILLPIHVQTNPSVIETSLATPLRQAKQTIEMDEQHHRIPPDRHSTQRSKQHTRFGYKLPVSPNRGHLYKRSFTRTLPSVPKSFRGPVCVSRVTRGSMWKPFRRTLSST